MERAQVLIAGAGPVGLTLAHELERHGVETLLVERNAGTTQHPKMDITNGRSMELFRRLGIADDLRARAVPSDHPMKVTWATGAAGWELASFAYPSVEEARALVAGTNDGTLPLEPAMRVSQVVLEPALRDLLVARADHGRVEYGWGLDSFAQDDDGVTAELIETATGSRRTVRAAYLAGCDGAGSRIRRGLGIGEHQLDLRRLAIKQLGVRRTVGSLLRNLRYDGTRPPDGRFYLVHFHSRDREIHRRFGYVWHLQSPEGWTLISQDDGEIWTLHSPLGVGVDADSIDPVQFVRDRLGHDLDVDVQVANAWVPRLVVADSFGAGRVWLAGDAVHQVTPTGGYGMNTGVGDAVGLGWALAANVQGWGTSGLLKAYAAERRAVAVRNRDAAARNALVRAAIMTTDWRDMHSEGWSGERTRRRLGREIADLGNLENEALGIELGYRYDTSPIIAHESGPAPKQTMDAYVPSTTPGVRPPSIKLADGTAIFDLFGQGFTLLRFAEHDTAALEKAAAAVGLPLTVVDVRDPHARALYERDLVLIRPDQHVAWRGDVPPAKPHSLIDLVRGVTA